MNSNQQTITRSANSVLAVNKVLRNTYLLLGLTLLFSAAVATLGVIYNWAGPNIFMFFVGAFGLMFLTQALRNSVWGLVSVFAFTGFMGYTLGPLLNAVIHTFSNGGQIVASSVGATGFVVLTLSAYALKTKKDFSFMGGFLMVLGVTAFLAMIAGFFFHMPMFQLVISGLFALFASGMILWETSRIVHGGETNYIMATISLYVAIYNLFVSLLQIFSALAGRD